MEHKGMGKTAGTLSVFFCFLFVFLAGCGARLPREGNNEANGNNNGTFHIVGMGPGDVDLLTSRALDVIRRAELVVCKSEEKDKLSSYVNFREKEVIDSYDVLFRYYGKDCANLSTDEETQDSTVCKEYHQKQAKLAGLLRRAVAAGKHVALLSGGDPTIYGPHIWILKRLHDLNPEVVPGLSPFNAANAALQVSLREVIITTPFKGEDRKDTIESLSAHEQATLAIFMPQDMKDLFARLSKAYAPETPVAMVRFAGQADREKVVLGSVGGFAANLNDVDDEMSLVYVGKALAQAQYESRETRESKSKGKFYLVGTGPSDADLATLRALEVMEKADLIFARKKISDKFAPYLAGKKVLDGYHRLFPFYGKECSRLTQEERASERMSCEEYHQKQQEFAAITRAAVAEGKTVAMLDNGDPLVYGPCSWTLTELRDLDTEVVPGLSCFNAANAALRVGVTEGKDAHSVLLASGWSVEEMAVHQSTMVLFTMRTEFKKFIDSLSKHYPPHTPVAIVFSAGYAEKEEVMHGTLGAILDQVGEKKLPFEYLLYVGDFLSDSVDRLDFSHPQT